MIDDTTPETGPAPIDMKAENVNTARDMVGLGLTHDYATDWLARQCPEEFVDRASALAALDAALAALDEPPK